MGAGKLKTQLWNELRLEETEEKCQEYLDKFFETYPGVKEYIQQTQEFVATHHFSYTFTGRRRRFPIAAYDYSTANRMGRQAVNARIQTTSSDLVCMNIIDVAEYVKSIGGRILLSVHDSILFQAPKDATGIASSLKRIISGNTAERAPWLPVEWKFDVGCGPNYGDTHGEVD